MTEERGEVQKEFDFMIDDKNTFTISLPDSDPGINTFTTTGTYTSDLNVSFDTMNPTYTFDVGSNNHGIQVAEDCDITIGDRSLKKFMDSMEKRLAILQPDPAKLEKFEALQKAYEHYKTLEALCEIEEDENES